MKIIKLNAALKSLKKLNDEIRYADFVKESNFTSGLIAFRAGKKSDPKQINHSDKNVLCQVIKGTGRLARQWQENSASPRNPLPYSQRHAARFCRRQEF